jgi:hypothetical protein
MKRFAASWAHELDYNSSETKRRGYSARDLVFFSSSDFSAENEKMKVDM